MLNTEIWRCFRRRKNFRSSPTWVNTSSIIRFWPDLLMYSKCHIPNIDPCRYLNGFVGRLSKTFCGDCSSTKSARPANFGNGSSALLTYSAYFLPTTARYRGAPSLRESHNKGGRINVRFISEFYWFRLKKRVGQFERRRKDVLWQIRNCRSLREKARAVSYESSFRKRRTVGRRRTSALPMKMHGELRKKGKPRWSQLSGI